MKFALVNGQRREAQPDLIGTCAFCGAAMTARAGNHRVSHWTHKGNHPCDPWWEHETEWHRGWKNHFPVEWQEIIHTSDEGGRHIADVKSDAGRIVEFQQASMSPEQRRARKAFYRYLVWVVNGTRQKNDKSRILSAWLDGYPVADNSQLRHVVADDLGVMREWLESTGPVFFDLGDADSLWCLVTRSANGSVYLFPVPRAHFIEWIRTPATEVARQFNALGGTLSALIMAYESRPQPPASAWNPPTKGGPRRPKR